MEAAFDTSDSIYFAAQRRAQRDAAEAAEDDLGLGRIGRRLKGQKSGRGRSKSLGRGASGDGVLDVSEFYDPEADAAAAEAAREYVAQLFGDKEAMGAALVEAAREGHSALVYELLAAHAPADKRCPKDGSTALHWCCKRGAVNEVSLILSRASHVVTWSDKRGWAPVHVAAVAGHLDVLTRLLAARGVDVSQIESECNKTPLHWACAFGHDDLVAALLAARAEVHAVNHEGETPLHDACRGGHSTCVRQLLAYRANPDGIPPLDAELALASKSLSAAMRLTCGPILGFGGAGASSNAAGNYSDGASEPHMRTGPVARSAPLHLAARSGRSVECVAVLLGAGATVDAVDAAGNTALHIGATVGDAELCERLLEGGASVDARSKKGATPLMLAAAGGHCAACMVLLAYGADPFRVVGTSQPCSADAAALLQHVCETNDGPQAAVRIMLVHKAHVDGILNDVQLLEAVQRVPAATAAGAELGLVSQQLRMRRLTLSQAKSRAKAAIANLDVFARRAARVAFPALFSTVAGEIDVDDIGTSNDPRAVAAATRAKALHAAAARGDADTIMNLLGAGADPNARDATGATPLHAAASAGAARACRVLLAGGADPCAPREAGPVSTSAGDSGGAEYTPAVRAAMDAPLFGRISSLVAMSVAARGETPADVAVGEARDVVIPAAQQAKVRQVQVQQQKQQQAAAPASSPAEHEEVLLLEGGAGGVPAPSEELVRARRQRMAGQQPAQVHAPLGMDLGDGDGPTAAMPPQERLRPPSDDRATPVSVAPSHTSDTSWASPSSAPRSGPPRVRTAW